MTKISEEHWETLGKLGNMSLPQMRLREFSCVTASRSNDILIVENEDGDLGWLWHTLGKGTGVGVKAHLFTVRYLEHPDMGDSLLALRGYIRNGEFYPPPFKEAN